jgi:hypothetical protein
MVTLFGSVPSELAVPIAPRCYPGVEAHLRAWGRAARTSTGCSRRCTASLTDNRPGDLPDRVPRRPRGEVGGQEAAEAFTRRHYVTPGAWPPGHRSA